MTAGSIQRRRFPDGICFGCGPQNHSGLRIESWEQGDRVVGTFVPRPTQQASEGVVCGGIISTVLDCHAAAAAHLVLLDEGDERFVVTKEMTVRFLAPTPVAPLELVATVTSHDERRAEVSASLVFEGAATAQFDGTFVVPRG